MTADHILPGWRLKALPQMEAAVRLHLPYKDNHDFRAEQSLLECECAYQAFQAGAAGALLDLITFFQAYDLPLPAEVAADCIRYSGMALSGVGEMIGRRVATPAAKHHSALVKRLRYEHVNHLLEDAAFLDHLQSDGHLVMTGSQLKQAVIDWGPASGIAKDAAARAALELPEVAGAKHITPEAIYRNYREVYEVRRLGTWPGQFYLPSEATCNSLGWQELAAAFLDLSIAPDTPRISRV